MIDWKLCESVFIFISALFFVDESLDYVMEIKDHRFVLFYYVSYASISFFFLPLKSLDFSFLPLKQTTIELDVNSLLSLSNLDIGWTELLQ